MSLKVFYIMTKSDGISITINGESYSVRVTHPNYQTIMTKLKSKEYDNLLSLIDIGKSISITTNKGKLFVEGGEVFFIDTKAGKTKKLDGSLVDRIIKDLKNQQTEKYGRALMNLLENINLNKSKDISGELYEWLKSGNCPITDDGCVLAYKKVRPNFTDIYSGNFDNSPGKIVRMPQADVDPDRTVECSRGLHFASIGYLKHYGSCSENRVVIVKVNPRHIFAIPTDYQFQKGRCSEYFVVGEYTGEERMISEAFDYYFVDEDNIDKAAPKVKFTETKLKPSLLEQGRAYGYIDPKGNGVKVRIVDNQKILVTWDTKKADVVIMSFETKSIRALVKSLVETKIDD